VSKPVRPNEAAEDEFRSYIVWYEEHGAGLGDRLWADIQTAIDLIAAHVSVGEVVRRARARTVIRRVPLRHFPFFLVYREHDDHIEIVALAHTSRKPNYWRDRLG
jgi:toxin ParE1/3/4